MNSARSSNSVTEPVDPPAACGWCDAPLGSAPAGAEYTVARCTSCGAYTTVPQPTDAELDAAYAGWYRPSEGRFGRVGDGLLHFSRSRLAGRLDEIAPPGAVLDVGAGDGTLVRALLAEGRETVGIEREAQGQHIRAAELESIGGDWAAITMWHSLEHLRGAGGAIDHAAGLLAPRGVLIVAVPNPASLQARLFRERWLAWDLPRHVVHLPATTLIAGLERRGLRVERTSYWRGGQVVFGWLHGLVGLLPGAPDLYDAVRVAAARSAPVSPGRRAAILATAALLLPVAATCAAAEVLLRRGGTVYVEARRD